MRGEASGPAIELQKLSMQFGTQAQNALSVLDGITFSLVPGEFVSIVGPSGCGKTTILNLLAGLLHHEGGGSLRILGEKPKVGHREVAYMLARDCLLPWRTTLGNAAYGMEIRGTPRTAREKRAMDFLGRVGLRDFAAAYPSALSQGMRQRCALARTFALDSQVLLMDEPFGALDAQTKLQLEDVLMELWSANERTVLFVTHDLAEAVALSDRVIVMSARPGRIVADVPIDLGRPRSVRALQKDAQFHNYYAELWALLEQGMGGPAHAQ